jgi:hypothetical protein
MRRILRKCASALIEKEDIESGDYAERLGLGDLSTLADPGVIVDLLKRLYLSQ